MQSTDSLSVLTLIVPPKNVRLTQSLNSAMDDFEMRNIKERQVRGKFTLKFKLGATE